MRTKALPQEARVSAGSVAASIEAIRAQLGLETSHPLYRFIAREAGVHPTTLLRYHRGRLGTAPHGLAAYLLRLRGQIARGDRPVLEGRLRRRAPAPPPDPPDRVKNTLVRRLLLELRTRLRVPPNMFYRHVGGAVDLHPVTVFRHADGQLATAPRRLLEYLRELTLALDAGKEVVFTRPRDGERVVPRAFVVREIERLTSLRVFPSKQALLRFVAAKLRLSPRALERAFSSRSCVLLPEQVLHYLRTLLRLLDYAPEARYEVGDRICHPVFGGGLVVGKEPKDKLAVEFSDGTRRVLRERLCERREWDRRESGIEAGVSVNPPG
jgi:hypothetical protein